MYINIFSHDSTYLYIYIYIYIYVEQIVLASYSCSGSCDVVIKNVDYGIKHVKRANRIYVKINCSCSCACADILIDVRVIWVDF